MSFVKVNADAIRRYLPEYHLYVETNPDLAGDLTNKEAGYIAEILALAGLQSGKNIMVDGSLRHAAWYREYFGRLRREFPSLRVAIIHVTAPREATFQRAAVRRDETFQSNKRQPNISHHVIRYSSYPLQERALQTGRVVPRDLIAESIQQVPLSVAELSPLVDYHIELLNDPKLTDIEIVTPGETWASFTSQWLQYVTGHSVFNGVSGFVSPLLFLACFRRTRRWLPAQTCPLPKQNQRLPKETQKTTDEKEFTDTFGADTSSQTGRFYVSLELK